MGCVAPAHTAKAFAILVPSWRADCQVRITDLAVLNLGLHQLLCEFLSVFDSATMFYPILAVTLTESVCFCLTYLDALSAALSTKISLKRQSSSLA